MASLIFSPIHSYLECIAKELEKQPAIFIMWVISLTIKHF